VSGKIAAHWLTTGLPVAVMAPLLGAGLIVAIIAVPFAAATAVRIALD
jgi:ABC-type transport system involved in cytochrome c biogenesis permease component